MTSKSDATAICVVESDNEYENSDVGCIHVPDGFYETCAKFESMFQEFRCVHGRLILNAKDEACRSRVNK